MRGNLIGLCHKKPAENRMGVRSQSARHGRRQLDERPLEDICKDKVELICARKVWMVKSRSFDARHPISQTICAQVRASHIFIKDRGRALTVLAKAKNADLAGFRKLAREESEDDKTKSDGGDLRFFEADAEGQPPAAVRDAAFSLDKVGAVYPDLVEEGDGYHIIMLTGKRAALKRTYEQAKRAIRHKLARERKDAAMEALTQRLRKEVDVEVDYEALEDVEVDIPDFPRGP